jgi:hypothetical protein
MYEIMCVCVYIYVYLGAFIMHNLQGIHMYSSTDYKFWVLYCVRNNVHKTAVQFITIRSSEYNILLQWVLWYIHISRSYLSIVHNLENQIAGLIFWMGMEGIYDA